MLRFAMATTIEAATGIETMIAIEIAATTITTASTGTGMETAMTADTSAGTIDTTGAMTGVITATTGAGTDIAGPTGMAGTGFTKAVF
jgi:hypothetical protein